VGRSLQATNRVCGNIQREKAHLQPTQLGLAQTKAIVI
jgi:hypothetical protein